MPNYVNPQSLNRYSYVNNNPIRYTDPTGHMMSSGDDGGCPKGCRRTLLNLKSNEILRKLGEKDDLKAMTQIIEYGATLFPTYDDLLPELTNIFNGVDSSGPGTLLAGAQMSVENGCAGVGREPRDCPGAQYYFSDTGFHPDFQDGHNQLFHLWGYIANTATPGDPIRGSIGLEEAVFANIFHEYVQSGLANMGIMTDQGWGTSWNDFVLSEAGMEIGILITNQAIAPTELADVIGERVGISGRGSAGVLQIYLDQYGPLYGTLHD